MNRHVFFAIYQFFLHHFCFREKQGEFAFIRAKFAFIRTNSFEFGRSLKFSRFEWSKLQFEVKFSRFERAKLGKTLSTQA